MTMEERELNYEEPEIEVIRISEEDIITKSGDNELDEYEDPDYYM